MANAYTDTSSGSLGTSLVQTAYDRYVEFALRAVLSSAMSQTRSQYSKQCQVPL